MNKSAPEKRESVEEVIARLRANRDAPHESLIHTIALSLPIQELKVVI